MSEPYRCSKGHHWPEGATVPLRCPVCGEALLTSAGTVDFEVSLPADSRQEGTVDLEDNPAPTRDRADPTHVLPEPEEPTMLRRAADADASRATGEWTAQEGDAPDPRADSAEERTAVSESELGTLHYPSVPL